MLWIYPIYSNIFEQSQKCSLKIMWKNQTTLSVHK